MPITINPLQQGPGLQYICHGVLNEKDFIEANVRMIMFGEQVKQFKFFLVDQTNVETIDISDEGLRMMTDYGNRIADKFHPQAIVAIVAPYEAGFEFARKWEDLAKQRGWDTMTFRARSEAEQWIRRKVHEKFGIELTQE